MTREIEYRAWDGHEMHHNVVIVDGIAIKRGFFATAFKEEAKAGKPMEYTGIKDKNGVKIFEGDILEFEWRVENSQCTTQGAVYFEEGAFKIWKAGWMHDFVRWWDRSARLGDRSVTRESKITGHRWQESWDNFQVAGNIYEHPHLIEKGATVE